MVESPSSLLYIPLAKTDAPDAPLELDNKQVDPELNAMVKEAPITSSIFKAEKYLVAKAGHLSRFRGISMAAFQSVVTYQLAKLFILLLPKFFLFESVSMVIAEVLAARISTGWTHIVISEPSSKYWFKRIPSFATYKKVVGPTLVLCVAKQVALYIPISLARAWDVLDPSGQQPDNWGILGKKALVISALGFAAFFLVVIPAQVTLTRVQASLLSEEDETIVPFDRTFGGRVVPEILGGSGMIGMLDAWKTFGVRSRCQLVKLYVKVFVMQVAVVILWATVTVGFLGAVSPAFKNALTREDGTVGFSADITASP